MLFASTKKRITNLNYRRKVEDRKQEFFSKRVRAGKRVYFFDVKATRAGDYYIQITESRKQFREATGTVEYEKHKMFLYKEDFNKFIASLGEAIDYVKEELMPDVDFTQFDREREEDSDLKWE